MSTPTLLAMVQRILSNADGDNVNSISDTVEAEQCASVIIETFDDLVTEYEIYSHKELDNLTALADVTYPAMMKFPTDTYDYGDIRYNIIEDNSDPDNWKVITYLPPEDFLNHVTSFNTDDASVGTQPDWNTGTWLPYKKDTYPRYWTTFDDTYVVFDAFDISLDTTMPSAKTLAWITKKPSLTNADASVPDLPHELFMLLRAEAEFRYWDYFKDAPTRAMDLAVRRARVRADSIKQKRSRDYSDRLPNYGR